MPQFAFFLLSVKGPIHVRVYEFSSIIPSHLRRSFQRSLSHASSGRFGIIDNSPNKDEYLTVVWKKNTSIKLLAVIVHCKSKRYPRKPKKSFRRYY